MSIDTRLHETGPRGGGGGGSSNSAGLAGTGPYYIVASAAATLPFSYVPVAGTNIQYSYSGSNFTISATTGSGASSSAGLLGTGLFFLLQTSGNSTAPFSKVISAGSSITTHTDSTNFYIDATTATPIAYAPSGSYFVVGSAQPLLPGSRILTAGSSTTVRTDATAIYIDAITNTFAGSAGLVGSGAFWTVYSDNALLPNSKVITAGSSITTRTDATKFYIDAVTNTFAGSGGLAGTGSYYIVGSAQPLLPGSRILTPGSSITMVSDATAFYISALTPNVSSFISSTGGLAGTGGLYVVTSASPLLPNSRILTAGSSTTVRTDATAIYIDAITNTFAGSGGLAGTGMFYIMSTAQTSFPNSRQLLAGSSIVVRTDATNFYIDAITPGVSANSGGLAGTGFFYAFHTSGTGLYPNSRVITAGSSVTVTTDATNIYISALTPTLSANSGGLAGTGAFFVTWGQDTTLSNEKVLTAGSSVIVRTDATSIYIDATTSLSASNTNIGTGGFLQLAVQAAKLYSNDSSARIDAGTSTWRLLFSPTTQQYGIWQFTLPWDYSGSPAINLIFSSDSSLSVAKTAAWIVDQWGYENNTGLTSIYVDTYGTINSSNFSLVAGYSAGQVQALTVPLINTISFQAGHLMKLRVSSSAGNVTGNQELIGLGLMYRAGTQTIATGSGGLQGTGGLILTAGTGVTVRTNATQVIVDAVDKDYDYYMNMRTGHMLGAFASVDRNWYLANYIGASSMGSNILPINTAFCLPFAATRDIKVDSMACNVTIAGSLSTIVQLAIYTNSADNVLFPFQAVSTSGFLTGSNLQLVAYNPATVLSANNLYWFCYLIGRSAVTLKTLPYGASYPIVGVDSGMGNIPGVGYNLFVNCNTGGGATSGFQPTMPGSGFVLTLPGSSPMLGVRGSI